MRQVNGRPHSRLPECILIEHTEKLRDELITYMDLARDMLAKRRNFRWAEFGEKTPFVIRKGLPVELLKKHCNYIAYVSGLILPNDCLADVDCMTLRADANMVKWMFRVKHVDVEWESEWFQRDQVISYLSSVRYLVDRFKEKQRGLQTASG